MASAVLFWALGLRSGTDRRDAAWVLGLVMTTAWMILGQHHPGFPRYAVTLLLVCMPGIAWAIAALPRRLGWLIAALASLGVLLWLHAAPLPVVAAMRLATADPSTSTLVYSHGMFSFARLEAERSGLPGLDVIDPDAPLQLPRHAYTLEGRTLHTLEGVTACSVEFPPAPPRAMRMGEGRFDHARLSRDAAVLGTGVHPPERDETGDRYAWMSARAALHLPAGATRLHVRLEVPDDVDGAEVTLEAAWVEGQGYAPVYARWSPGRLRTVRAHDVELFGFEGPEVFAKKRRGAWTRGEATATMPARPGRILLRLARPEHAPGSVTLETDAESRTLELGPRPTEVELRTEAPRGRATLRITTPTFTPADVRVGSQDTRSLGLILYEVTFVPDHDTCQR